MPTQKIDPKVIFASNAPAIDKPPVFGDKTKGWDVARANDGRPEIKQMNKLQQDTDLKILWLNENSVTPYDESIDYPDGAVAIKDGSFKQLASGAWVEFLDDFANKDKVKRGIANRYDSSLTYNSGERVVLTNGDIVKSTIDENVNDPNVDMTGWRKPQASEIFDESGLSQQEINTFYEGAFQFVDNWGAVGDGVTQDSTAINNAITAAHNLYLITGRPTTLKYRNGATYVAHNILLKLGVNHVCDGHAEILKTPATTGQTEAELKWRTILTIETQNLSSIPLVDRVLISGITLNGNYENMNWTWGTYNQQQGSSLKLYNTTIPTGSRFKIELRDFKTINSVADGVTIGQNIDIIGSNIEMHECCRGGIVHTGGNTIAKFNNIIGENANIHIEIDGKGHGDSYKIEATYNNVEIDAKNKLNAIWGGFYATPSDGAVININNFKCHSLGFYIQGGFGDRDNPDSSININDSYFVVSSSTGLSTLYFPPNMNFSNTHIHHIGGGDGLNWYWKTVSGETRNRKAIFRNGCKFTSDGGIAGVLPVAAIKNIFGYNALNNYFEFYDTSFDGFQYSLDSYNGCQAVFGDGCNLNTTTGVRVGSYADRNVNLKFGRVSLGNLCSSLIFSYLPNAAGNTIRFNGTEIQQEKLAQHNTGDFDNVEGLLTLIAKSKPNATRNAWQNTVWKVVNAGLGQPFEYKNYSILPARSANWRAVSWLTASGNTASRPALNAYDIGVTYLNTETNKVDTWTGTVWI